MKSQEISRQLQRINGLIAKTDEACGSNLEMQSHWAKYICILAAGLLENAIKDVYSDYAKRQVSQPIAKFVNSNLSRIRNPKTELFIETAGAFKDHWKQELTDYVDLEGRREAIDSIMNQRHLIVHGSVHNSNISLTQIKSYLSKAVEVVEFIEKQCSQ